LDLNANQELAVKTIFGPVLIVAGPGSGKTRTIVERIKYIVSQNYSPRGILAVTFTRAAAAEMKKRLIEDLGEPVVKSMTICTFHSLAVKIMRDYGRHLGYRHGFSVYDERDSLDILGQVVKDLNIKRPKPDKIFQDLDLPKWVNVKAEYRDRVRSNNAVDFDMLIENALRILKNNLTILQELSHQYQFVSVDEFQDLNARQYEFAKLMASDWKNICAVGDPDQNIYAFQGSNIKYILDFTMDFPGAKVIYLDQCYRCPSNVLTGANALILNNRQRLDKPTTTDLDKGVIQSLVFDNDLEENLWIATKCKELYRQDVDYSSMAILARTHRLRLNIIRDLTSAGVPINACGRTEEFFKQDAVVMMLNYLRVIENPHDGFSFRRIINFPNRNIDWIDLLKCEAHIRATHMDCLLGAKTFFENSRQVNPVIVDFLNQMTVLNINKDVNPSLVIDTVAALLGTHYGTASLASRDAQTKEAVLRYRTFEDGAQPLSAFLEYASDLDAQEDVVDASKDGQPSAVQIMTAHTAKGLEFPIVFVPGLEKGSFPISAADNNMDEMEQERRLFYVAATRTMFHLYLTRCRIRSMWGKEDEREASPFVEEFKAEI